MSGYCVVFQSKVQSGYERPVRRWTSFANQTKFKALYTGTWRDDEEVIAEGATQEEAIQLVSIRPVSAHSPTSLEAVANTVAHKISPVNRADILRKYRSELGLMGVTPLDFHVLKEFLPQFYAPSESPLVMIVGASIDEAKPLRMFHQEHYKLRGDDVKIVACNIRQLHLSESEVYDAVSDGPFGDAGSSLPWEFLAKTLGREAYYDLVYVRAPDLTDLIDISNWKAVFEQASFYVRPEGAILTLIFGRDVAKYERLLGELEDRIRIMYSGLTGILEEHNSQDDAFHTVGILKPR